MSELPHDDDVEVACGAPQLDSGLLGSASAGAPHELAEGAAG